MKKLLLIPFLFALACGPAPEDTQDPSPVPVPQDTVVEKGKPEDTPGRGPRVSADTLPTTSDFCRQGEACDWQGDRVLASTVDRSNSTFQIIGQTLLSPGDTASFVVCAKDVNGAPVEGLPAVVRTKGQSGRQIAGDGTTKTKADGCVTVSGVLREEDMSGDPRTPEPDSGSKLINAYVGGRVLNQVRVLHDSY